MNPSPTSLITLSPPWVGDEELYAIKHVLDSGRLVQGPLVERFEQRIASRCNRNYAIAVSSGTSALELALNAIELDAGDEVICPALSWPSPAHAIILSGATPVIVDVHAKDWNLDPEAASHARGSRTRAAIVIDQFGMPARWSELQASLKGLILIEDAACGIGSYHSQGPCGSFGTISILSFHPRKVVTTGEGGMCLTDDPAIAERLRILRNHGQRSPGIFLSAAGNQRLSEIAAAMGLAQLDRLDTMLEKRRFLAQRYRDALPHMQWQAMPAGAQSNMQTMGAVLNIPRDPVIESLRRQGIESARLSYELSMLPSIQPFARVPSPTQNAQHIATHGLALPLHPNMNTEDQDRVIQALHEFLR